MPTHREEQQPEQGASTSQTENLLENLGSLSDDQFFHRLSALRAEHKQTLLHYEQLYHEKLMAETDGDIGLVFGQPLFATTSARQSADGSERPKPTDSGTDSLCVSGVGLDLTARRTPSPPKEQPKVEVVAPSQEPAEVIEAPRLETFGRDYNLTVQEPVNTGADTFNQSLEILRRSADKPPRSPCPVHKCKEAWTEDDGVQSRRRRSDSSGDEADYANYDETRYQKVKDAALDRIESMWDDFALDDYKERRKSSDRPRTAADWRHRITMPEPFSMTLREESKAKQKSRTLSEYEHQKSMREMNERFECEKKFRAAPVPAHVYMPLYDELTEKAETRRRTNVQVAKEVLKSREKPFHFNERQKTIPDHGRRHSAPIVKQGKQFKAKPIPKSIREDVSERILEEEEYRKIRIRMRSKELLRAASLPPRMASREQYTVGKLKEKLKEEKERNTLAKQRTKKFQPRIKRKVPDFETIHRKQSRESANQNKKEEPRIVTVCEPFHLSSSSIPSSIDKILKDIRKDEEELTESRWPYKNPRAKPKLGELRRSYDTLPSHTTTANELRQSKNYDELRKKSAKELQDDKNRQHQSEMARLRRRQIAEKARANDQTQDLRATNAERLKRYREEERVRLEEYKKELAAMETRVSQQPFLFERQTQINARKRAEKRFEDALRDAGVDDQSLSSLTRRNRGPRSPDEIGNLTDDDEAADFPTHDADPELNATYDAAGEKDEDEYHYSHSFVDDDEATRKDTYSEKYAGEMAA